ncbi:MAG: hypothetical protein M3N47_13875, partial [Chloroflexota bacterium]|nr:hypothetical protein [Chloroflexota bacterium]
MVIDLPVVGSPSFVVGQWSVVGGQWSFVGGRSSVVGGRWSVVGGRSSPRDPLLLQVIVQEQTCRELIDDTAFSVDARHGSLLAEYSLRLAAGETLVIQLDRNRQHASELFDHAFDTLRLGPNLPAQRERVADEHQHGFLFPNDRGDPLQCPVNRIGRDDAHAARHDTV